MNKVSKTSEKITLKDLKSEASAVAVLPNASFFQNAADFVLPANAVVKTLSPLLSPRDFPVGKVLVGRFTKIFETNPTKDKKGVGIEIVPDGSRTGIALAAVATISQALEIDDVSKGKQATSPHLGKIIAVQILPDKLPSKKGKDAWNFLVAILTENSTVNSAT